MSGYLFIRTRRSFLFEIILGSNYIKIKRRHALEEGNNQRFVLPALLQTISFV